MIQKNKWLFVLVTSLLLGVLVNSGGLSQSVIEHGDQEKVRTCPEEIKDTTNSESWALFAVVDMKLSIIPYYSNLSGYNLPTDDGVYPGIMVLNFKWNNAVSDVTCFGILTQETETYQNNTSGSCLIFVGLLVIETTLGTIHYTLAGAAFCVQISSL